MRGRDLTNNVVVGVVLAILVSFAFLYSIFSPPVFNVLLNSTFCGVLCAIGVTYHKLLWDAWFNPYDFNRVRQMTLTVGGQWVVIALFILTSIYANFNDYTSIYYVTTLFGRYLAVWIAIFQVTAPDYGDGLFYGADRKFLGLGIVSGILVGFAFIWIQGGVL